jgi:capsular exopolysaccharide synthesis family protein
MTVVQPDVSAQEPVDLSRYIAVLRARRWTIGASILLVLVAALLLSLAQSPVYQSTATILVKPITTSAQLGQPAVDLVSLQTEAEIVQSAEVASRAAKQFAPTADPEGLLEPLEVQIPENTQVLEVTFSDPDPLRAQRGAAAFAQGYLDYKTEEARNAIDELKQPILAKIRELTRQLEDLDRDSGADQDVLTGELAVQRSQLAPLNSVVIDPGDVIEPPVLPSSPSSPNFAVNLALALMVGLALGVGTAFLRERLEDRLEGREDLEARAGAPVLAVIPKVPGWKKGDPEMTVALQEPKSAAAEAYRTLRTGFLFLDRQRDATTAMFVSAVSGEGKTTTVANLGVVLAQAGKQVILVSADLRKPRLHRFFKLRNRVGLVNCLSGEAALGEALANSGVENLRVLPSGPIPTAPAELLGSEAMGEVLHELRGLADFVLVDTPAVLAVTDALTLAPLTDAVLYVADAQSTTRGAVAHARTQLEQVGAGIGAAVLNGFDPSRARSYPYYGYAQQQGYSAEQREPGIPDRLKVMQASVVGRLKAITERRRIRPAIAESERRPRRWRWYLLGGMALLAVLITLALAPSIAARDRLVEARGRMEAARSALASGDAESAQLRFQEASTAFDEAAGQTRNPFVKLVSFLPILGRTPDAVLALADAGRNVARAGAAVAATIEELPGGVASVAPRQGRISRAPLERLLPALQRAAGLVDEAERIVSGTPDAWILGPVAEGRREFAHELADLAPRIRAATILVQRLPWFLGYEGRQRYFFGASNPAELRGTGGLIGAYGILTADQGRLSLSPFKPIQALPDPPPGQVRPPNPGYARRYPGAWTFWSNINLTPDFPSAAEAIENLWAYVEGEELDGVIVADPFALEGFTGVTGPVHVPTTRTVLTAEEVVPFVTNEAYTRLQDPAQRKGVLGEAARAVFGRLLQGVGPPAQAIEALVTAATTGHLEIHTTDPQMQRGLELTATAGRLLPPKEDYLSVVLNNSGGNKLDYYARYSVGYAVRLGAEGTARSDIAVNIDNRAPTSGMPSRVIGPFPGASGAGENVSTVSAYLPGGAIFEGVEENGRRARADVAEELGHAVVERGLRVPSGKTGNLLYNVSSPAVWDGSSGRGTYRLTFQSQPTINPMRLTIDIQTPEGTDIVWTSLPMEVSDNRARWSGVAPPSETFEVRFQKSLIPRLWDSVVDFFGQPVVGFVGIGPVWALTNREKMG